MTQNSRRLSGSKPFDVGLRKSEADARQRARETAQAARDITPEQQALLGRQLAEGLSLSSSGASRKALADAKKRWQQERDAAGLDAVGNPIRRADDED